MHVRGQTSRNIFISNRHYVYFICVANNIITQPLISNSVLVVLTTEKKKPSQLHFFQVYLTKVLESHTK